MKVNLEELAGGAAVARFNAALIDVVANMCDINTDAEKKREIVLKVGFKPNRDRDDCEVTVDCITKLAPESALSTALQIGVDPRTGEVEAIEPYQQPMFTDEPLGDNIVELAQGGNTND